MSRLFVTFVAGCLFVLSALSVCSRASAADVEINGSLSVKEEFSSLIRRYVPITAGDLMHSGSNNTGDAATGVIFPPGVQSGGSITFPLPADYIPGTDFHLDLFLVPWSGGTGQIDFFVRWVGLNTGGFSGTGYSVLSTPVTPGNAFNIVKQSFVLDGFSAEALPEMVALTIRRMGNGDTFTANVILSGVRLSYQASR